MFQTAQCDSDQDYAKWWKLWVQILLRLLGIISIIYHLKALQPTVSKNWVSKKSHHSLRNCGAKRYPHCANLSTYVVSKKTAVAGVILVLSRIFFFVGWMKHLCKFGIKFWNVSVTTKFTVGRPWHKLHEV